MVTNILIITFKLKIKGGRKVYKPQKAVLF